MGNGITTLYSCLACGSHCGGGRRRRRRRHDVAPVAGDGLDDGLGHSFCYLRPDPLPKPASTAAAAAAAPSSKVHHSDEPAAGVAATTFRAISGAAVSANTATPPLSDVYAHACSADRSAAAFEGTTSFAAIPLQPLPRSAGGGPAALSGPIERGFMSGPIERGFLSGPLDRAGLFSGPLAGDAHKKLALHRSFSHGGLRPRKSSLLRAIKKAISKSVAAPAPKAPILVKDLDQWVVGDKNMVIGPENLTVSSTTNLSSELSLEDEESMEGGQNSLQWAQGKAGEDRVHVVVSEENGWVFVGIYDGFNGPDAPDYLLSHLYQSVHHELKGLLWKDGSFEYQSYGACNDGGEPKKWRSEWERERVELERRLKEQLNRSSPDQEVDHADVLQAMSEGLRKTEEAYFEIADLMLVENPELALMGSCVLVMLMKGEHVYLMNVGDSRAVLSRCVDPSLWELLVKDRDNENSWLEMDHLDRSTGVNALQLTVDHSTNVAEEVERIRCEHADDECAVVNDRVKGSLKVTRAFGAGFLKKPKWNNALLEVFQVDYVGSSPYLSCNPSLYHHKLGPKDRFLILSSDGLYQYFTNEEAVAQVELFLELWPEGDPAQHLVEEVLFRAAKKAGIEFHELLEIPHGDRRRYHDDVSIIVISLEGRIWRSSV